MAFCRHNQFINSYTGCDAALPFLDNPGVLCYTALSIWVLHNRSCKSTEGTNPGGDSYEGDKENNEDVRKSEK